MFQFRRTIFSSDDVPALLERNGLGNLDALFTRALAMPRRRRDRVVCPLTLTHDSGETTKAFVKLNWGFRRIVPRVKDIRARQLSQSLPGREWSGLHKLLAIGLRVPKPLALLEDGTFRFRAAVVLEAIPVAESLAERLLKGEWQLLPQPVREAQLKTIVSTIDAIHTAGLRWRGASTRHLFFESDTAINPALWLIDCEGVQRKAAQRDVDRDFQKLLHAFRETGATEETLDRLAREIGLRSTPQRRKAA